MSVYESVGKQERAAPSTEERENIRRAAASGIPNSAMLQMLNATPPKPLPSDVREHFESGFHADFSNVRVSHASIPKEMGFRAAVRGTDILLDRNAGLDTLGHELTHVVQTATGRIPSGGFPILRNPAMEHEADTLGARVASGGMAAPGGDVLSIPAMSEGAAPIQCSWIKGKDHDGAGQAQTGTKAGGKGTGGQDVKMPANAQQVMNASQDEIASARANLRPAGGVASAAAAGEASDGGGQKQVSEELRPQGQPTVTVRSAQGEGKTMEIHELPRSADIQAALGEDVGKYPSYGKMLAAIDTLCVILTMQQDVPASASAKMVDKLVDAYDTTIAAMQGYYQEMSKFAWSKSGRQKRSARCAYVKELMDFAQQDKARIMQDAAAGKTEGKSPAQVVSQARTQELADADFTGVIKGGAINQVYRYKQGFFKPSNGGKMNSNEKIYADDIGLKYEDSQGNAIDPHMNEREVASSRLDKLLGGGVIGGAKKAQIAQNSELKIKADTDE